MTHPVFAKPFAWSYSKLKNFETCPKRHFHLDLVRDISEKPSDAILWGNYLHDKLAKAVGTDDNHLRSPRDRIIQEPLPADLARFQPWVAKFLNARAMGAKVYAEINLAITREFAPCAWFDKAAWFRTKVDVLVITSDGRMAAAYDYKTGRRQEDSPQLSLTAIATMAHYRTVEAVRTEFVWLKEMRDEAPYDCVDRVAIWRKDQPSIWNGLAPRVQSLESAFIAQQYPPRPGPFCRRWCPVNVCEHHGK